MQIYADVIGLTHPGECIQTNSCAWFCHVWSCRCRCSIWVATIAFMMPLSKMGALKDIVYKPIPENQAIYEKLYAEYVILHDYFGRGENDVMKRLKAIKASSEVKTCSSDTE